MADIFDFYVYDDRSIQFALAEPIMLEDKDVTQFRFRIPKSLNGFDMSDWEWWFIFVNPKGNLYSSQLTLTDDEDEPDEYANALYTVGYGFSGITGTVKFAIEVLNLDGDTVVNEWHTKTYSTNVTSTLQGVRAAIPEPEGQTVGSLIAALQEDVESLAERTIPEIVLSRTSEKPVASRTLYDALADKTDVWVTDSLRDRIIALEEGAVNFSDPDNDGNIVISFLEEA